jgi:hypothetical protein
MLSPVFSGFMLLDLLVLCVMFCTSLFAPLSFFFWPLQVSSSCYTSRTCRAPLVTNPVRKGPEGVYNKWNISVVICDRCSLTVNQVIVATIYGFRLPFWHVKLFLFLIGKIIVIVVSSIDHSIHDRVMLMGYFKASTISQYPL